MNLVENTKIDSLMIQNNVQESRKLSLSEQTSSFLSNMITNGEINKIGEYQKKLDNLTEGKLKPKKKKN
jgi:hypothetical protein